MFRPIAAVGALALALTAPAAQAHHSYAMFDRSKTVTLNGTIRQFQWTNPHSWIQLVVKDSSGKDVEWSIEGGSPNNLARKGWSRNSLKSGDKVVITIHPLKNGDNGGSLMKVSVNGTTLD